MKFTDNIDQLTNLVFLYVFHDVSFLDPIFILCITGPKLKCLYYMYNIMNNFIHRYYIMYIIKYIYNFKKERVKC